MKLALWRLRLSKYEFDVFHRPGVKHQGTGALLRLETDGLGESRVDDDILVSAIDQNLPVSHFSTEEDNFICSVCDEVH